MLPLELRSVFLTGGELGEEQSAQSLTGIIVRCCPLPYVSNIIQTPSADKRAD
jgi:hypothetical protein